MMDECNLSDFAKFFFCILPCGHKNEMMKYKILMYEETWLNYFCTTCMGQRCHELKGALT